MLVLAVCVRCCNTCNKFRIEKLQYRPKELVEIGRAGNEIQGANGQMEMVKTVVTSYVMLEAKWTFVPNFKKFPVGILEILHSQYRRSK